MTGLGGAEATLAIARLAVVRAARGKAIWIALALALVPAVVAAISAGIAGGATRDGWPGVVRATLLILPILPSILIASSLADEFEDKTAVYLWSRALPRWSIVSGKLVGLAPIVAGIMALGLTAAWLVMGGPGAVGVARYGTSLAGLVAGALAACAVAAAWATLLPRQAVAASIVWLLFVDLPLAELSFKIHYLSAAYAALAIGGGQRAAADGVAAFAAVSGLGLAIAWWRVRRRE